MKIAIILNNIRSSENVGSIFRTADAVEVEKIYLTGYTPAPIDRFGKFNTRLVKASLGAEKSVQWKKIKTLKEAIQRLKEGNPTSPKLQGTRKKKFRIIAIEQNPKSKNYKNFKYLKNVAFVFGNEVTGLSQKDLALCDEIIEIPMKGKKESLNVAVAAGIILFSL